MSDQSQTRVPIGEVENGDLTPADLIQFVIAAVDSKGLVGHNLSAFDEFLSNGIRLILETLFELNAIVKNARDQTPADREVESITLDVRFRNVQVGRPVYAAYPIGKIMPLYPNEARRTNRTYAAPLTLGVEIDLTARYADGREEMKQAEIPPFQIAYIPIMVGSNRCHTYCLTREARKGLEEDPNEAGGYFLAKGGEWVVECAENTAFNRLHIHLGISSETVRGEFISQPGGAFDNSSQVIVRLMANGAITIEINSTKFAKTKIPFFLIFRLLGMTSDADILEAIAFDPEYGSPVTRRMIDVVSRALRYEDPAYAPVQNEIDRERLTAFVAERLSRFVTNPTAYKTVDDAVQYLNKNLLDILDRVLLPHVGRDAAARGEKLRFLGMLIHKVLLAEMGVLEPTDRDNYSNKRVHGAAVSLAKAFKTQFNNSMSAPVVRALKRLVRGTSFSDLTPQAISEAVKNTMAASELSRTFEQAITRGDSEILIIRNQMVTNRVSSQPLERKNPTNYYSALRAVSAGSGSKASKQTDRADRMRRVHPSYVGYICVAKSADTGEKVGMSKELAITATICSAGDPYPLIIHLLEDPAVIPLARVATPDILRQNLASIFVNGRWIGCCRHAHELVDRYRRLRREGKSVNPQTSIVWNPVTDDVSFLLDVGRLARPLLIVDNNLEEYDESCRAAALAKKEGRPAGPRAPFVQNIRLTPAHVKGLRGGKIGLDALIAEGVAEWITPEEAENCLVAESLGVLRAEKNNVARRFTHCDIEQAIYGLTALASPYGNHTQPARVTYHTNQCRQAGTWYCNSAHHRADKNRFFQHYIEAPLISTISNQWLIPNGINTVVAYMISEGYNQEDSAIIKKSFVDRGGFTGAFYRTEKIELEKNESFRVPDFAETKNLKPNASYEKLAEGGFVKAGTRVAKGDVIVGRVCKVQASGRRAAGAPPDDGYKYIDRSIVYQLDEPAYVVSVEQPRGPDDSVFCLVKLRYHRPLVVGDKLSSRAGNKSISALLAADSDLPYDDDGVTPDIIINPHSIPTRMTIGQMIEAFLCLLCQHEGVITDGTSFSGAGIDAARERLVAAGFRHNGLSRLYNGRTGEWLNAAIFMAPTFQQRLQKFVKDDEYAVGGYGPTDALTGQPLEGKNVHGGLRIGEMETWVLGSHGAAMTMYDKLSSDSDGMKQHICTSCGRPGIFNAHQDIYRCALCGESADIVSVDSCRASIVFQHEVRTAGVKLNLGVRPHEFEKYASEA